MLLKPRLLALICMMFLGIACTRPPPPPILNDLEDGVPDGSGCTQLTCGDGNGNNVDPSVVGLLPYYPTHSACTQAYMSNTNPLCSTSICSSIDNSQPWFTPGYSCGGVCVALSTDTNNCGHCGVRCPAGVDCIDGTCGFQGNTAMKDVYNRIHTCSNQFPADTQQLLACLNGIRGISITFKVVGNVANCTTCIIQATEYCSGKYPNDNLRALECLMQTFNDNGSLGPVDDLSANKDGFACTINPQQCGTAAMIFANGSPCNQDNVCIENYCGSGTCESQAVKSCCDSCDHQNNLCLEHISSPHDLTACGFQFTGCNGRCGSATNCK